jgi:Uroporphyrinogen-III synthase
MNVLLLRKEEDQDDKYHLRFQDPSIENITSIPVLAFEYYNLELVRAFVETIERYSGMIFTSRRAITAFEQVTTTEQLNRIKNLPDFSIYVVGRATGNCISQLGFKSTGSETGNAQELSELIISEKQSTTKPLMFLCGNLARETIPRRLTESGIPNEFISCYKTVSDGDFKRNFELYLKQRKPSVVVFFSPSGAEFHIEKIKNLMPNIGDNVKVACIGDYTSEQVSRLGIKVSGVASKPTPDDLFDTIQSI